MDSTPHPNVDLVSRALRHVAAGDLDGAMSLHEDDAVLRVPGSNPLSGIHQGKDAIRNVLAKLGEVTGGTLTVGSIDILADDRYAFAVQTVVASREGRNLEASGVVAFRISPAGKLSETWFLYNDQAEYDAFYA